MKTIQDLKSLIEEKLLQGKFVRAVISGVKKQSTSDLIKVEVKPVTIKEEVFYQITEHRGQQVFHRNVQGDVCVAAIIQLFADNFKQMLIFATDGDYQVLMNKDHFITILRKPATKAVADKKHNRLKHYILNEGVPIPFLVELGVMNRDGKVKGNKRDKFQQINRFLEMVRDILPHLDREKMINIIDFGCGKAYLTFALYHYLHEIEKINCEMVGIDLKADVMKKCQAIANALGYRHLKFVHGDINAYEAKDVDIMVSLHACDTATDAALEKAIRWGAKVILAAPCCQHELFNQVKNEALSPILSHGILKERFAALATDAARVQLLEVLGYKTQILEFIDMEHTPKNLLIRAVKASSQERSKAALETYLAFKKMLNITPSLETRFFPVL